MKLPAPKQMGTGTVKMKTGGYPRTITFSSAKRGAKRGSKRG